MGFRKPGHYGRRCAATPSEVAVRGGARADGDAKLRSRAAERASIRARPVLAIALAAAVLAPAGVRWAGSGAALAQAAGAGQPLLPNVVHPAVVRVMAADRDGFSLGSGTLVAVSDHHGLVVTNWHVVRDAAGPIVVAFPNGFRSAASVLKTDQEWDLAALAVWRPNVEPVPLASLPPRPGEPLTIAGYGSGQYRMITGRCTQYVSPGYHQPFEMVELSAPARQGDSGGPIFNSRGELAGVLFGTAAGQTSGSYCGRVRAFLTSVREDFFRLRPNPALYAQQPVANPQPAVNPSPAAAASRVAPSGVPSAANVATDPHPGAMPQGAQVAANRSASPAAAISSGDAGWTSASAEPATPDPFASLQAANPSDALVSEPSTLWNDAKNYLAVVGVGAILFHAFKFLAAAGLSKNRRRRYYY